MPSIDVERRAPRVEVDVRRRRRREQQVARSQAHAATCRRETPSPSRCGGRRRDATRGPACASTSKPVDRLSAVQHAQRTLRDRHDLAPQRGRSSSPYSRLGRRHEPASGRRGGAPRARAPRPRRRATRARARRQRRRGRSGCASAAARAAARRRARRAACRRCDSGPGSTSTSSTCQQQMTFGWPRCRRSIGRIDQTLAGRRSRACVAFAMWQARPQRPSARSSAATFRCPATRAVRPSAARASSA